MTGKQELGAQASKVVLAKVRSDSAFKAKLLAGANEALAAVGINVPPGVNVKFMEDTATTWTFVIPATVEDGELSDSDLDLVSGGFGSSTPKQLGQIGQIGQIGQFPKVLP